MTTTQYWVGSSNGPPANTEPEVPVTESLTRSEFVLSVELQLEKIISIDLVHNGHKSDSGLVMEVQNRKRSFNVVA